MKQFLIALLIVLAIGAVALAVMGRFDLVISLFQPGFTDEQINAVERDIREYYLKQMRASSSVTERQEVESGMATVAVQMVKVSPKRLEGFVLISNKTPEAKAIGLDEVRVSCEATLGMNPNQYLWKCQNK